MKTITTLLISLLFLTQCSNPSNDETALSLTLLTYRSLQLSVTGKAVKGNIKNGQVDIYKLNPDGSCDTSFSLGRGYTDEGGNYSVSYSKTGSSVCVSVTPKADGTTRMYDEKSKKDISVTDANSLNLSHILREDTLTANKKSGMFLSPFSRMLMTRVQTLKKANPSSNIGDLTKKAGRELVIRFGLSKLSTRDVRANITEENYPELDSLSLNLENPSDSSSKQYLMILAGLSQLGNKYKTGSDVSSKDIDKMINLFSSDIADGKFDGKDSSGSTLTLPDGKEMGADALTNLILPAIQEFIKEGGAIGTGSTPITISAEDLSSISFQDSVSIISSSVDPANLPAAFTYPTTNLTFYQNYPISASSPTVAGTGITYSINPSLPAGLTFNTTTGAISGTPTATQASTAYTITATNSYGSTSTTINISVVVMPGGCAGSSVYSYSIAPDLWLCAINNTSGKTWTDVSTVCNNAGNFYLATVSSMTRRGLPTDAQIAPAMTSASSNGFQYVITGQPTRACYWDRATASYETCNGLGYIGTGETTGSGSNWVALVDGNSAELRAWPSANTTNSQIVISLCQNSLSDPSAYVYDS
ncbi:MAG: putative Ig domain-containing protein, partial [Leptospiraceae bacterium]|nr:putative Ig domain-containing protein [Leptospiraceae bacterium]